MSFWTVFCPFTPYGPKKSKFLKNEKNTRRYYHFTNVYHKWQMMYYSWDMECNRQNSLSFGLFCPFTPLTTQKINILKKWKNCLAILSFHSCVPKMTIIWCMVPEILSATDRIFCHFGPFFSFTPLTTWKIQILKKWSNCLEILSFHTCAL